jgi:hypothetical protein
MPETILLQIEESFAARYSQKSFSSHIWQSITEKWPPILEPGLRPSLDMARRSGDAGLALLWVVQAALVKPVFQYMADPGQPRLGALCHADGRDGAMIMEKGNDGMVLTGSKGFVSGGPQADLLLVTGRSDPEGNVDRLVALPAEELATFMEDLPLPALHTVPHGRFAVRDFKPGNYREAEIDPARLRRILKKSGLLERSSIVEMACGLGLYLAEKTGREKNREKLETITREVSRFLDSQLETGMKDEKIPLLPASLLGDVFTILSRTREEAPDRERERCSDLEFLLSLFERLPSEKSL